MIEGLNGVIALARSLANDHPCKSTGHLWKTEGGRQCPRRCIHASQAVYRCARCETWDYGDPGGPGHADCFLHGPCARQDEED